MSVLDVDAFESLANGCVGLVNSQDALSFGADRLCCLDELFLEASAGFLKVQDALELLIFNRLIHKIINLIDGSVALNGRLTLCSSAGIHRRLGTLGVRG